MRDSDVIHEARADDSAGLCSQAVVRPVISTSGMRADVLAGLKKTNDSESMLHEYRADGGD